MYYYNCLALKLKAKKKNMRLYTDSFTIYYDFIYYILRQTFDETVCVRSAVKTFGAILALMMQIPA